jgi:hypothetical protein
VGGRIRSGHQLLRNNKWHMGSLCGVISMLLGHAVYSRNSSNTAPPPPVNCLKLNRDLPASVSQVIEGVSYTHPNTTNPPPPHLSLLSV